MRRSLLMAIGVLILTTGAASGQNLRMGTRYHLIDKEVESVTTGFKGIEVTTARLADGKLETLLRTNDGRAIGRPLVTQPEEVRLVASQKTAGAPSEIHVDLQPLDAVNADRYLAWKDRKLAARKLFGEMPKELIGSEGPVEMRSAGDDIMWVKSRTRRFEAYSRFGGKGVIDGRELPAFTSVVRENDEVLAVMAWFSGAQTLVFQTRANPEPRYFVGKNLPNGGWTFKPNMAWANIQLLSFAKSAESHATGTPAGRSGVIAHNSPGCDGLHWLDGTIFRQCCDIHDACYYREDPDCGVSSWWFQGGWTCQQCNIDAIFCFAGLVGGCLYNGCMVLYPDYGWGNEPNCYIYFGCVCPAWCYGCDYVYGWGPCP